MDRYYLNEQLAENTSLDKEIVENGNEKGAQGIVVPFGTISGISFLRILWIFRQKCE
ncbi:MAG: hypothetical protein JW967_04175 [Dehalococcoidales bacterium]|nr:hypothetical protein [Dehalococcoidales bacterium]